MKRAVLERQEKMDELKNRSEDMSRNAFHFTSTGAKLAEKVTLEIYFTSFAYELRCYAAEANTTITGNTVFTNILGTPFREQTTFLEHFFLRNHFPDYLFVNYN